MKKISILFFTVITLLSCSNTNCEGDYNIPSQKFTFEIIDKTSGENLFSNGTFVPEEIQITNTFNNYPVEFSFIAENNIHHIQIKSASLETKIINLKFVISNNHLFDFYSKGELIMKECFSYTKYKEITIKESEFIIDAQTGVYNILVE